MKSKLLILTGVLIFFAVALIAERAANANNPGMETDVKSYLRKGMTNIVDFYSVYCPPCRQISPLLEKLDQKRDDIVVIKLDINRPETKGIDWSSPLTRQYGLHSIPHFQIYDGNGQLLHEGEAAYEELSKLFQEEGIDQP